MRLDVRVSLGLCMIALALVAIQMKALTSTDLAVLLVNGFAMVYALLTNAGGGGGGRAPREPGDCTSSHCPMQRPPTNPPTAASASDPPAKP